MTQVYDRDTVKRMLEVTLGIGGLLGQHPALVAAGIIERGGPKPFVDFMMRGPTSAGNRTISEVVEALLNYEGSVEPSNP